jgi:hypothetical protein
MQEALRVAFAGIPGAILAFVVPPAIWAKAVWASPFVKTHRRGLSGCLSFATGSLLGASVLGHNPWFPVLFGGALITMTATLIALLWPPAGGLQ